MPTDDLEAMFAGCTPEDLAELAEAGWGEGDHQDPHVDPGLLELHVAIEATEAGLL